MEIFLGRQPILDTRQTTVAYELLYRSSQGDNAFPELNGTSATSSLLYNLFYNLGVKEVTGGKKAFVNFTRDLIITGIPEVLSPKEVIIEVLEDSKIDQDLINALEALSGTGFVLALDDFVFREGVEPLLSLASIVKVDWQANSQSEIQRLTQALSKYSVLLLAEKVETGDEFRRALEMGYKFFQGFFFEKPRILKGEDLPVTTYNWMEIFTAIQRPELDIDEIVGIITKNPSLSYQLLKIINAAGYGFSKPISSIRQAVVLLGEHEIRRWLSLLLLAKMNVDKPHELLITACLRGRFGELVANQVDSSGIGPTVFFMGILSLLDAIVGRPLEELLLPLPLEKNIVKALISNKGPLAIYLQLVKAYEKADHKALKVYIDKLCIDQHRLAELYIEAVRWTEGICKTNYVN